MRNSLSDTSLLPVVVLATFLDSGATGIGNDIEEVYDLSQVASCNL